jgi:hypothetical protein
MGQNPANERRKLTKTAPIARDLHHSEYAPLRIWPGRGADHDSNAPSSVTSADIISGLALAEGTCRSLLFGLLVGALFALTYNLTAGLGRLPKEQAR